MAKKAIINKTYKWHGVTYNYAGNTVTGTSTSAKTFPNSKISSASKNDTYLNVETGHVYLCDTGGGAGSAKWKYKKTVAVEKPTVGVRHLTLTRGDGNRIMTANWKLPKAFAKETSGSQAEKIVVKWALDTSSSKSKNDIIDKEKTKDTAKTDSENLADIYLGNATSGKHFTRADFYPYARKPYLNAVSCRVAPTNKCGTPGAKAKEKDGKTLIHQVASYAFEKPGKPYLDNGFSFNTETGTVSGTIKLPSSDGKKERAYTTWRMEVTDMSRPAASRTWTPSGQSANAATGDSINFSYNVANYQELADTEYVRVRIIATAKGYAGDSDELDRSYYVSFPKSPTIDEVKVSSKESSGKVTAKITVTKSTAFPVDRVKLQKLVDVDYTEPGQIPGNAGWEDAGAIDDGECTALVCGVTEVEPSTGKHSWLRVKAWHGNEDALFSYSNIMEVKALYESAPSAEDNVCTIYDPVTTEDGGADVLVAWDLKSSATDDDTTSMELAWSEDADAWRSVKGPESYEFDWHDDAVDSRASATWNKSANVKVDKLSDGTKYYFRARCLAEHDGVTTKGAWCNPKELIIATVPPSAVLAADAVSPTGSGVSFSWALSALKPQTAWQLVSAAGAVVMEDTGSAAGCIVPWTRVETHMVDNTLTCSVRCSTDGEWVESDQVAVTIAEPPTLALTTSTLTAQPFSFGVSTDMPISQIAYSIVDSNGTAIDTGIATPAMTLANGAWGGTVELEGNREFLDEVGYTLTASATSTQGLESEPVESGFEVDWAHKAPEPPDGIEITPEVIEQDDGSVIRRCTVQLAAPTGAAGTDVYDVYRLTHDGIDRISPDKGLSLDYQVVDNYAPYGDSYDYGYRIVCRTADGDTEFADYYYELDGDSLRFDYGGTAVELPYNINISDSYAKDAETRMHLDGTNEAYYNPGVTRKASLRSDVLRIDDAAVAAAVRALARHPGTAFVRTPDGSAYEAHVEVNAMDADYETVAATFDAVEVATSDAYKLPIPLESGSVNPEDEPDEPVEPEA